MFRKSSIDMTSGSFVKNILRFSVPLMLTGVLQLVYNTADSVVVGRFAGKEALAAVGATASLINLIINLFIGLSMGAGVLTARYIGARDNAGIKRSVHTAMTLSLISGAIVAVFGFFTARQLLIWMDSPKDVIDLSTVYLKIYFLGAPGSMVYNFGAAIVRSTGDTKRPLIFLSASGLVNVALNLVTVIGFGMGVSGVALATIASQYISALLVVIYLMRINNSCRLVLKALKLSSAELKEIIRIGVPVGIQNSMFSIANVIIQTTVNSFGSAAMAGIAAGSNFDGYIYVCTNAVTQAAMTFTSQNIGARKYGNIKRIFRVCLLLSAGIGVVLQSVGLLFPSEIVKLFNSEPDVVAVGVQRTMQIMPFYVFCSVQDTVSGVIRGMGKSFSSMLISLFGTCVTRLIWVFFLLPMDRTIKFLFWAYPVSWALTFVMQLILYFVLVRKYYHNGTIVSDMR